MAMRKKISSRKRKSAKKNPRRKRKVLHGAAKLAHEKKLSRLRRKRTAKKNPKRHTAKRHARKAHPKRGRRVLRAKQSKTRRRKKNPTHGHLSARVDAISNRQTSMDGRLHTVEKKVDKWEKAIGHARSMGALRARNY